jgi:hypothetical protein
MLPCCALQAMLRQRSTGPGSVRAHACSRFWMPTNNLAPAAPSRAASSSEHRTRRRGAVTVRAAAQRARARRAQAARAWLRVARPRRLSASSRGAAPAPIAAACARCAHELTRARAAAPHTDVMARPASPAASPAARGARGVRASRPLVERPFAAAALALFLLLSCARTTAGDDQAPTPWAGVASPPPAPAAVTVRAHAAWAWGQRPLTFERKWARPPPLWIS